MLWRPHHDTTVSVGVPVGDDGPVDTDPAVTQMLVCPVGVDAGGYEAVAEGSHEQGV